MEAYLEACSQVHIGVSVKSTEYEIESITRQRDSIRNLIIQSVLIKQKIITKELKLNKKKKKIYTYTQFLAARSLCTSRFLCKYCTPLAA